jgi:excisionase family DNA binding protein
VPPSLRVRTPWRRPARAGLARRGANTCERTRTTPRLLTVRQAAKTLSLGVSTVHELIRSGALVSVKIGAARRVPVEALDKFLEAKAAS